MSDSEPYKQLRDQSTALKGDNGEILGVPFVIESYGLIYNKDLLNKYFPGGLVDHQEHRRFGRVQSVEDRR